MNYKRIYVSTLSIIGFISIFMPWIVYNSYTLDAVNDIFNDGYCFGVMFLVILVLSMIGSETLGRKRKLALLILSVLILIFAIGDFMANQESLTRLGASFGIGFFLTLLSSAFIAIYVFLAKQDGTEEKIEFNSEDFKELGQKSLKVANSVTKVSKNIVKSAIDEVKKEIRTTDKEEK